MSDSLVRHASWRISTVRRGSETAWVSHPYSPPSSAATSPQALHFPIKHTDTPVPPSLVRRISAPDTDPLSLTASPRATEPLSSRPLPVPASVPELSRSATVPTRPTRTERLPSDSSIASCSSADSQRLLTPPATPPTLALHLGAAMGKPYHDFHHFRTYDIGPPHMRVVQVMPDASGPSGLPFQFLNPSVAARQMRAPSGVPNDPYDTESPDDGLFGPLSPPETPSLRPIDLPARSTSCTPVYEERLNRFDAKRKCGKHRRAATPRPVPSASPLALGLLGMDTGAEGALVSGGPSEDSIAWVHFADGRST